MTAAGFFSKKIKYNQNIGQTLKEKREQLGFTFNYIEEILKINKHYLLAIEENDYISLPDDIYTKKYIMTYAEFLGYKNNKQMAEIFIGERRMFKHINNINENLKPRKKLSKWSFFLLSSFVKKMIIFFIILIILFYLGYSINKIFTPPPLLIIEPQNNLITEKTSITIKGETSPETTIKINDQNVILDTNGTFNQNINLQLGINLIKITAKKKHSKEKTEIREILVVQNNSNNLE